MSACVTLSVVRTLFLLFDQGTDFPSAQDPHLSEVHERRKQRENAAVAAKEQAKTRHAAEVQCKAQEKLAHHLSLRHLKEAEGSLGHDKVRSMVNDTVENGRGEKRKSDQISSAQANPILSVCIFLSTTLFELS